MVNQLGALIDLWPRNIRIQMWGVMLFISNLNSPTWLRWIYIIEVIESSFLDLSSKQLLWIGLEYSLHQHSPGENTTMGLCNKFIHWTKYETKNGATNTRVNQRKETGYLGRSVRGHLVGGALKWSDKSRVNDIDFKCGQLRHFAKNSWCQASTMQQSDGQRTNRKIQQN